MFLLPIHFLFPEKCSYCGKNLILNQMPLCASCMSNINTFNFSNRCNVCGSYISKGKCNFCTSRKIFFNQIFFVYNYSKEAKVLLKKAKFEKRKKFIHYFEIKINQFIKESIINNYDYIFMMPSSNNFLQKITLNISKILNVEIIHPFIINHKKKQKTKGIKDRHIEIKDKIFLNSKIKKQITLYENKKILLIDDVWTTGASMNYSAKLLITNGIKKENLDCLAFLRRDKINLK